MLSTIYIFIPVSGCVGRDPVHCFAWGSIVLLRRYCTALMWMKSYLNDRTRRVAVDSVVSNAMHLQCGVPQISVLGPRLYCIFAKPSSEICRRHNFSHQSYVDDTQVYKNVPCNQTT
jgi:hypothetical protein